ncbi:GPI mannosyltransferase 2 [Cladobotryum mycophilum]|uniref:GPI mannosyltransferase 2 n=1 Tax=Cladobotryum mycophilum TaxID=491253 RepID=A0ABR0S6G1_9HYPO
MGLLSFDAKPFSSLTVVFLAWKAFLLAIALGAAVGPDYDTSTSIFFEHTYGSDAKVPMLASRLTRWDALYFMYASRKGYVYEQQWAFGAALPTVAQSILRHFQSWGFVGDGVVEPLLAIAFTHFTHLIAVLSLHKLTTILFDNKNLAYVASLLHIISPAGLFLSAPYSESPFACLSFIGYLLFAQGLQSSSTSFSRNIKLVSAGIVFGISIPFRTNGLLNGILFAVEAIKCLQTFIRRPGFAVLLTGVAPVLGGLFVAAGSIVPQAVAWLRYCHWDLAEGELRPWCSRMIPSIYTFVQEDYWNGGFLKYWTPSHIPLFLLASPMLAILIKSGVSFLMGSSHGLMPRMSSKAESHQVFVRTLAAIQLAVAILAITNFHVQIITRLSSGYSVWYWWVASCLGDRKSQARGWAIVVFMVMYGSIQGGLFASFLPQPRFILK